MIKLTSGLRNDSFSRSQGDNPWDFYGSYHLNLRVLSENDFRLRVLSYVKARLNDFNICFNMRSTQLLNQMSGRLNRGRSTLLKA